MLLESVNTSLIWGYSICDTESRIKKYASALQKVFFFFTQKHMIYHTNDWKRFIVQLISYNMKTSTITMIIHA